MTDEQFTYDTLLNFFKTLSDGTRLRIVGLLANKDLTGEQLAAILDLKPATVSHHMVRLTKAGLVSGRGESYYRVYSLNQDAFQEKARLLLAKESLPQIAANEDASAYDRKVLKDFSKSDGTLRQIPVQLKKRQAIMRLLIQQFKPGQRYTEKQVNNILAKFHHDTAFWRRELITEKFMSRHGGEYWLNEPNN